MKIFFLIFIVLVISFTSFPQSTNDIGKIALSVVMPENVENLDVAQLSKLETRISLIVTKYGLAASGYNSNFVIYPKIKAFLTLIILTNLTKINGLLANTGFIP